MKRTTMFILALALASIVSEYAYAQWFYWPWAGYQYTTQCANGQCGRVNKPSAQEQLADSGDKNDKEGAETEPESTPAVAPAHNPSIETPPAEPADEKPVLAEQEIKPFCVRVAELINAQRKSLGLPPLELDPALCSGCDMHSRWMTRNGFQHAYGAGRECIAMGVRSPEAVVNMWLNSSGHRAILLGSGRIIGVGVAGSYWTLRVR